MRTTLEALFDLHIAAAYDKQEFLRDLVGDREWGYHLLSGTADFSSHRWRAQILGTESLDEGTWTWAWASQTGRVPEELLLAAEKMRRIGREMGLPQLITPQVPLDKMCGETVAILASGLLGGNAYARGEFEGGAMYVLIDDPDFPPHVVDPIARISGLFPEVVRNFACHHRRALRGYLQYYNLAWEEEELRIVAENMGELLEADFDYLGRMKAFGIVAEPGTVGESVESGYDAARP